MIIISGKVFVDKEIRDEHDAAHQEMAVRARNYPGSLDLVMAADPLEAGRMNINIFECWETEEQLDKWRAVANPPKSTVEPERVDVQKHQVSASGPPFQ